MEGTRQHGDDGEILGHDIVELGCQLLALFLAGMGRLFEGVSCLFLRLLAAVIEPAECRAESDADPACEASDQ